MAGVQELAAAVRIALGKLSTAKLTEAAGLLGEAAQALIQTGSQQHEVQTALSGFGEAERGIGDVSGLVGRIDGTLTDYLERIGANAPPEQSGSSASTPTQPPAASAPAAAAPNGQRLTREQAKRCERSYRRRWYGVRDRRRTAAGSTRTARPTRSSAATTPTRPRPGRSCSSRASP